MAIVKTTFTAQTLAGQAPELLAYLQANAGDYFDEITADTSGNISCKVGETTALLIGMDGTTTRSVSLTNGATIATTSGDSAASNVHTKKFIYGKKTSKGVLLAAPAGKILGSDTGLTFIFISKNENGDTCILGTMPVGEDTYNAATSYFGADIKNDENIYRYVSEVTWAGRASLSKSAPVTALTPAIFSGGHYAPNVFLATFNQFALVEADLSINDKSYATDGVMALAD